MITRIRLQQFRSYEDATFAFGSGVNVIVGPNASGKTNLLEAILVNARGSSYRAKDSELVRHSAAWVRIEVEEASDTIRTVKLRPDPAAVWRKTFEIDEKTYQRLSHQKMLPVVLFEPNHLLMLSGAPDMRRSFLDDVIEQLTPGYATLRRNYRRVLAQRNALLKKGYDSAKPHIFVWNLRLSEFAGKIVEARRQLIEHINAIANETYQNLASTNDTIRVEYQCNCPERQYETALLHRLEASLERDALLGFTTFGPHRDDMQVLLNDHPSSVTASRGESRTIILALKIVEFKLLEKAYNTPPLLLLDDVFSELDSVRRSALVQYLSGYQTFITTTDADTLNLPASSKFDTTTLVSLGTKG